MSEKITIDRLLLELERAGSEARDLVASVTDDEFNWKSDPGTWSIGECLDHLVRTNEKYHRGLQRVTAGDALPSGRDEWRAGLVGGMFLRLMEPPVRRKVSAPAAFRPEGSSFDREETLERFMTAQRRIEELLVSLRGRDLSRLRVSSPVAKWLKFSVAAAFAIIASHERRHLWQARQIVARLQSGAR